MENKDFADEEFDEVFDPCDPDGYPLLKCGCGWSGAMEEAHVLGDGSEFVCPGCNEVASIQSDEVEVDLFHPGPGPGWGSI